VLATPRKRDTKQLIKQSLDRRSRQVQLSTQIAQEIAAATDLSDLYHRVVQQVKEQFGYYHTQLLRYDPALDTIALIVGYGEVGEKMLALNYSVPIGVGLIGRAAETGQSVLRPAWQRTQLASQPAPAAHARGIGGADQTAR
jgi:hypothetical protein